MGIPIIKNRLLLAIDDENSILLFESILGEYEYLLKILNSFEAIYEEYKNRKYDLVILTTLGISASHILKYVVKLKMFDPKIKMMIISNYDKESIIESLSSTGIDTIYKLPIDFEFLHSRIQSLLNTPSIKK